MDPAEKLREFGFRVHEFNTYHFRVNNEIDYWLPRGKWHDLITNERGKKPLDQLAYFIKARLDERTPEISKELFIQSLIDTGWTREEGERAWDERQANAV